MWSKTKFYPRLVILMATLFFCLILAGTIFAGHASRTTYFGLVGKRVIAQKDTIYVGNSVWNGGIYSHTQDGTAISSIGWTYWTFRELCNGVIKSQTVVQGAAIPNSSGVSDLGVDVFNACSYTRQGHVLGNHEFKNIGYPNWYKDWVHGEPLP